MQYNVTQSQFDLQIHRLKLDAYRSQSTHPDLTFKFELSHFGDYSEFIITNGVISTILHYDNKRQTLSETTLTNAVVEKIHKMKEELLFNK